MKIKKLHYPIKNWQEELAEGFNNIEELCHYLDIPFDDSNPKYDFQLRVPRSFVKKMKKGDSNDPLLKQVLPITKERLNLTGYSSDPVADINAITAPGIIDKYQNRVLLIATGSCAINCRYCFRKNFPYADFQISSKKLNLALQYIQDHTAITEVILSGGDPLLLNDEKLFNLIQKIEQIDHIKRIRIHSRIPIVLPSRITPEFCKRLDTLNKPIIMVLHCNHKNELDNAVEAACNKLRDRKITLLNQSVLLKGINDNAEQLCDLSEKLFTFGVMPYYLHLLDKAHGTGHFEVNEKIALSLMKQIKTQLSGYLVPKLVREVAGAKNKILIA
ncbi:MAG: EF-P beta-lysylation protein EpmB [Methylococcales symbiont of Iophon sp. n. MRB-2018]|nr:MAG: EF-P beta-lysylation protein EpmB [Methylococcales symbiont of Iophon sp. n. MRB-2018]KAF3980643.1 MAG: EF-P beta-lysylation protein EpmB [Methylococcales symbiont of Iophon sp. n. MRB-2018]